MEVATPLISWMRRRIPSMAPTALPVAPWMRPIYFVMSSVAHAVWLAGSFISDATTAKPRPASPARA
jgi:hypothetical protein